MGTKVVSNRLSPGPSIAWMSAPYQAPTLAAKT
jgi:hypothetical protein